MTEQDVDLAASDDIPGGGPLSRRRWWRRPAVLVPAGLLVLLALGYGVDLALAGSDVPRGTTVAGVAIGGLSHAAAEQRLTTEVVPELARSRTANAGSARIAVDPVAAGIELDPRATAAAAGGQPLNPLTRLTSLFGVGRAVEPVLSVDRATLTKAVDGFAGQVDTEPVEGTVRIEGTTATAVPPEPGATLDRATAPDLVVAAVEADRDQFDLDVTQVPAKTSADQVQQALDGFAVPALSAPVTVTGRDGTTTEIPVTAIAKALRFSRGPDGTLTPAVDAEALQAGLGDRLDAFRTSAVDAGFTVSGGSVQIVPAKDGLTPDVATLAKNLLDVLPSPAPRTVELAVTRAPADLTTEDAKALGITEQISTFTTNFTNEASGENIRVVAAYVDGAVVRPGETFSLNGYTGPRTEAQGYIESTIISNGEFVQAVGGGISQFATTMFNAVFFAGLEDVYHQPHSYYISRYPAGREATVFYDSIDLSWRNDSDTGVYVQTSWAPGAITVTFWGTKHVDVESVSGERHNYTTPDTERKPDTSECLDQAGQSGFDIAVTRVFHPVGSTDVLRREVFNTRYKAVPEIICVPG
ncbi:MAG: VanW family protein [Geodermatophilaceae bacterium]